MSARQIILLLACGFLLFTVSRSIALFAEHTPQPQLEIMPTEVDLGAVRVGQAVERGFLIRNTGDARLLVTGVQSSCQCTVAELPTRAIAPGVSVQLHVTFKANSFGSKS